MHQGRLYFCPNIKGLQCHSWDLETGEKATHEPLHDFSEEWFCYYSYVSVNGKIWVHGGFLGPSPYGSGMVTSASKFLGPDFTWSSGPYIPHYNFYHTSVAIDETRVVGFGGRFSNVWVYDDASGNFESKASKDVGSYLTATLVTDFIELGNNVILVQKADVMKVYDWKIDQWSDLDSTWNPPYYKHYYNAKLFHVSLYRAFQQMCPILLY